MWPNLTLCFLLFLSLGLVRVQARPPLALAALEMTQEEKEAFETLAKYHSRTQIESNHSDSGNSSQLKPNQVEQRAFAVVEKYNNRLANFLDNQTQNRPWVSNQLLSPPPPPDKWAIQPKHTHCTKGILVSSQGTAHHLHSNSMGLYTYLTMYNSKPAYKKEQGSMVLYFSNLGWMVGPFLGSPRGALFNHLALPVPFEIPEGWKYVNNGFWYSDHSLVVRCVP